MKNIFNYNKKNSTCCFCLRINNPHPDYDEPLVTTVFEISLNKRIEICINCFEEIEIYSKEAKKEIKFIIKIN